VKRRNFLALSAPASIPFLADKQWAKPVISAIILPAHAQTSDSVLVASTTATIETGNGIGFVFSEDPSCEVGNLLIETSSDLSNSDVRFGLAGVLAQGFEAELTFSFDPRNEALADDGNIMLITGQDATINFPFDASSPIELTTLVCGITYRVVATVNYSTAQSSITIELQLFTV